MTAGDRELDRCANCGAALHGPYCAACGQERRPLDPTLIEIVREAGQELSDLDGRAVRSLLRLFSRPGLLTQEHFAGRRASWLPPIRLYLVVSLVYFAVSALTDNAGPTIELRISGATEQETQAELERFGFASQAELERTLEEAEATWAPRAMFVLVPIFGGLVHFAQRRTRRHYPHHLIFALHVHTAWFAMFALLALIGYFAASEIIVSALGILAIIYALVYLALAFRRVYGRPLWQSSLQSVAVGAAYVVITVVLTAALVVPAVLTANA